MSDEHPFEAFASIPRLIRSCVISEKIDGTNAQVFIPDDLSCVKAGSRSRWITPADDNYGFAAWVEANRDELLKLGPGRHFGEWWGAGIQRRYGMTEKRFSLFNAGRWSSYRPACCHIVPVLYAGTFSTDAVEKALADLATEGSRAAPGFMKPEGVVVWLPVAKQLYKKTLGDDGHKSAKFQAAEAAP